MDCPFCHNTNTFSAHNKNGKLSWYCFHSSCSAKGIAEQEKTIDDIRTSVMPKPDIVKKSFTIPEHFTSVYGSPKCIKYIEDNNCHEAMARGLVKLYYDPKQERIVFIIRKKNNGIVGAVGRGLSSAIYPKWFMYGDKSHPFICGKSDKAILVEDCASACAVSNIITGVALLGTSLPDDYIPILKQFKKITIALDRDATSKAFDIHQKLCYYVKSQVKILDEDLKYFTTDEIRKLL
jgi:hypothetical protein